MACGALGAGEQDAHVYRDVTRGFEIARPVAGWRFLSGNKATSTFVLRMRPSASQGDVEVSVRVRPAAKGETAEVLLTSARARIASDKAYSGSESVAGDVGGHTATGIRVHYKGPNETDYLIEQRYLTVDGEIYIMQFHAPRARWKKFVRDFEEVRKSFRILPRSAEARALRRRSVLAGRCGSEIRWARSWSEAAERAKRESRLVLVQVRNYPGFTLPDRTRSILYMDPDIVEIIGSRLVALRYHQGMQAPFRSQKVYGMSKTTFGQAVLLVTPEGKVLAETSSIHPVAVYEFLVAGLERYGKDGGGSRPKRAADLAHWYLARGEMDLAARALDKSTSLRAHRLRASMFRRLRQGDKALAELSAAREAGDKSAANLLAEIVILLRLGRDRAALKIMDRELEARPELEKLPAVLYWKGACDARAKRRASALQWWSRLMADHPDDRWAWKAAALAKDPAALSLSWPDETRLATLRTPGDEPLGLDGVAAAEGGGIEYLLDHQREDGSWISPVEVMRTGVKVPHPFTQAISAICGRAMLQRPETNACKASAARALEFVLAYQRLIKKHPLPRSYMDYTVWSKAFSLWFFADCIAAKIGDEDVISACCRELVADLQKKQKPTGGWSYYVTGDLEAEAASLQSISFVTAPVLRALLRARDEGVEVPDKMLGAGLRCLEQMRSRSGDFAYFLFPGGRRGSTGRAGSAGRAPACELALFRGGKSSLTRMREAVDIFMTYRDGIAKEVGKVLMHAGPDGQGCHYPMFDYAFAAEAIRTLPSKERSPHRARLIELIMATRSKEGAFRDAEFNGWAYGTAMALLALHALRVQ